MNKMLFPPVLDEQSRFEYWVECLHLLKPSVVAEVGVWKGEFARFVLSHCDSIESYLMIDPWTNLENWNKPFNVSVSEFAEVFEEAMERTKFAKDKRILYRETTTAAVKNIDDESIDFAYIDGDHTLRGITLDLISILPKVKIGGVIGGDDFTQSPWQHSSEFEPTLVCPFAVYFAEAHGLPIYSLGKDQYVILNRPDLGFVFEDYSGNYSDLGLAHLNASHS